MWDGNRELVEEDNFELLETGRSDPMNKCFQVGTKTSKSKTVKLGECDGCYNRLRVSCLSASRLGAEKKRMASVSSCGINEIQ